MNKRDALLAGLLALILMVLLMPFARLGVDFHHDGIMLKPALDVLSGQMLFRDTFMQYGALTCYVHALALWVQPSLLSLKFLTVAAYGATLFVLYAAWRIVLPRSLTILSALLFVLFIPCYEKNVLGSFWTLLPWSSVLAMLFQSVGLYSLFQIIRGVNSTRWAVVLGAVTAAVFWCRQPVGVIMFASLIVIWAALDWTNWRSGFHSKRSILVGFCGGSLILSAPMLMWIVASGAAPAWWYQNFIWPRKWAEAGMQGNWSWGHIALQMVFPAAGARLLLLLIALTLPGVLRKFRPALSSSSVVIYYVCLGGIFAWRYEWLLGVLDLRQGGWTTLIPVITVLVALVYFVRAAAHREVFKSTEDYLVAAWSAFSAASILQYFPVPDAWHIVWSAAPVFGLLVFVFWRGTGWRPVVMAGGLVVVFLPSISAKVGLARQLLAQPWVTLGEPSILRGSRVSPEQAWMIGRIVDTVKQVELKRPGIPSALTGNDALFLCFTQNLANPSPYFVTWKALAPAEALERRRNYISQVRPLMFLVNQEPKEINDFLTRSHYAPVLHLPEAGLMIAVPQELTR